MGYWEEDGWVLGEVGEAVRSCRRGQIAVELQPTFIWSRHEFCRLSGVGFLVHALTTANRKHTAAFSEVKKREKSFTSRCCRCCWKTWWTAAADNRLMPEIRPPHTVNTFTVNDLGGKERLCAHERFNYRGFFLLKIVGVKSWNILLLKLFHLFPAASLTLVSCNFPFLLSDKHFCYPPHNNKKCLSHRPC